MKSLPQHFAKNVEILKINLGRGMTAEMANNAIDGMEQRFEFEKLYNDTERAYINEMRATVIEHFTKVSVAVV